MINAPKNSPLVLKMVVLVATMACSVFICSFFLKQLEKPTEHHVVKANLAEMAQVHSATVITVEKNLTNFLKADLMKNNQSNMVRENRTQKILSHSITVNLTEATIPVAVRTNTSAVGNNISVLILPTALSTTSTEEILPKKMGVNLTDKSFSDPKLSKYLLHRFDYNKTKAYIRDENECMPVSLYAIVSMQRSGSKWFEALLNSHENIRSHGEIFYNVDRKCNMTVIKTVLNKVYNLNWNSTTFRRKKKNCMAAVGFKWMLNQQTMMRVLEFLRAPQRQLISGHVKIHTRPLAQQIQNWKAVVRLIKRTKFRNFIASNDYKF